MSSHASLVTISIAKYVKLSLDKDIGITCVILFTRYLNSKSVEILLLVTTNMTFAGGS